MKIAVRYYSKSGNTKKLAEAIAEELGVKAIDISKNLSEKVDLLFFGSSVYAGKMHKDVQKFLNTNKVYFNKLVCFGTSASGKSTHKEITKWASQYKNVDVSNRFFHCPGKFLLMHKDRPNEQDLTDAKEFARKFVTIYSSKIGK